MPTVDYVLTTFSPAMFGEGATAYIRIVTPEEASERVGEATKIVATRISHEKLAQNAFPGAQETARYAMLKPGTSAIHIHYRGPQVPESGAMPAGGMITFYLIEVDVYQEAEGA
jgi:hypothetical protein